MPTHTTNVTILMKATSAYKFWHGLLEDIPRLTRYTLGSKIDGLFAETVELILIASYTQRREKLAVIQKATQKLDSLKFFLQIAWELKALDNKKYMELSTPLTEVGRMLGGWRKQAEQFIQPARDKQTSLPRK